MFGNQIDFACKKKIYLVLGILGLDNFKMSDPIWASKAIKQTIF